MFNLESLRNTDLKKASTRRIQNLYTLLTGREAKGAEDRYMMVAIISSYIEGVQWKDCVPGATPEQYNRYASDMLSPDRAFSEHDIRTIRLLHQSGWGYNKIAKLYGKQPNYIRNIVKGKIYRDVTLPKNYDGRIGS